ncbi:IclR family transcriptional regulator [Paenibacillus radicis (ex Xue et al. 2023)]|uniref:IclR family transcriptional regulator n=1 Tax=Paenibacillus radicis (ex Xue et al. 2023) TaxID=2972489 RepID=A0ABT1Y9U3_9BACL|nr:IclR family transcriptional regulator [Paenibacillus radicis (ex Xue et al. 2023)]MCR8629963.1 IclR family transcriptional regulator [Paenibacillus radicis (ex Xue et al. 2023)]
MEENLPAATERKTGESRYAIESVMKTLQVLFSFCEPPYRFTIGELESLTGLSKNQVFRSLKSLEEFGLLRMEAGGQYLVTAMVYNLSMAVEHDAPLEELAQPIMEQLQQATGETVNLCCLLEGQSTIIARRHSKQGLRLMSRLGERMPLHAGACPKAMLAHLPVEEQEKVLSMVPHYQKMTEKTVSDPNLLRIELDQIRKRGYSISDEDYEAGAIGVGAPIFGKNGKLIAAISAGGPTIRVSQDDIPMLGQITVEAANKISRILGYFPTRRLDEPQ